jgi:hypothetical protein
VAGGIQVHATVHAKMSAFQRFLQDFATRSNRLDVDSQDSQEYEDVGCSQIYLPGLDETEIVDEENETFSTVFLHWFDLAIR